MNKSVLVIENHRLNSKLINAILEANDFIVHVCPDSETALRNLTEKIIPHPDIIILDLTDDDPFSKHFCQMVLVKDDATRIPVIATSNKPFEKNERENLGVTAYLYHPYSLFELISLLYKCLGING